MHCHNTKIKELELTANSLRKLVIEMLAEAKSGHTAGSLGTADIFAALYFHILNIDPKNPNKKDRDRFILSNGHICPILYAALAQRGFFSKTKLKTLRQLESPLQGHPHNTELPGIEASSGPLGHGLSQAIGMALAAKMDKQNYHIYCMTSDGELQEGQTWEAAMFAGSKRLNNLIWIIDRNNIQISGKTEDVLSLEPLREKLESFNWYVLEINGHNIEEIISVCNKAKSIGQRPSAIIAHTIPGKGVNFIEYKFKWHGKHPSKNEKQKALTQLRKLNAKIRKKYE